MTAGTRSRLWIAAIAAIAIGAIYFASPYFMLWRLQRAAERDDTAVLEQLIDFPQVRATMREEAAGALRDKLAGAIHNKLVAGLMGGSAGPDFVNRMIDEQVTPAGAAQMIKGAKLEHTSFSGLTRFDFEAGGLKGSAVFTGFGWRVIRIGLPGQ